MRLRNVSGRLVRVTDEGHAQSLEGQDYPGAHLNGIFVASSSADCKALVGFPDKVVADEQPLGAHMLHRLRIRTGLGERHIENQSDRLNRLLRGSF